MLVRAALHEVDVLFKDYYKWKARLYDPQTGGFYFAHSALEDTGKFRPDIETTAQALGRMKTGQRRGCSPVLRTAQVVYLLVNPGRLPYNPRSLWVCASDARATEVEDIRTASQGLL